MLNFAISFVFRPKRISCVPRHTRTLFILENLIPYVRPLDKMK